MSTRAPHPHDARFFMNGMRLQRAGGRAFSPMLLLVVGLVRDMAHKAERRKAHEEAWRMSRGRGSGS
jgi:hypothetical protein